MKNLFLMKINFSVLDRQLTEEDRKAIVNIAITENSKMRTSVIYVGIKFQSTVLILVVGFIDASLLDFYSFFLQVYVFAKLLLSQAQSFFINPFVRYLFTQRMMVGDNNSFLIMHQSNLFEKEVIYKADFDASMIQDMYDASILQAVKFNNSRSNSDNLLPITLTKDSIIPQVKVVLDNSAKATYSLNNIKESDSSLQEKRDLNNKNKHIIEEARSYIESQLHKTVLQKAPVSTCNSARYFLLVSVLLQHVDRCYLSPIVCNCFYINSIVVISVVIGW